MTMVKSANAWWLNSEKNSPIPTKLLPPGFVDDVILPHETRPRLIAALELLRDKQISCSSQKTRLHAPVILLK